jgi:hypothetical protein
MKTLTQFKDWAVRAGAVSNPTVNTYLGECVSLVQEYINQVYGIPYQARGHAKDWATNGNVLSYFDKVGSPQAGDIGVSGATKTNPYGHIWVYLSPTQVLEQNGRVSRRVSVNAPITSPIAILRRKGAVAPAGGDMVADKGFLDRVYSAVLQRARGAGEGDNVYLNKDAGWVFNDIYNSGEANVVRAREAQEDATRNSQAGTIQQLQNTINGLNARPTKEQLEKAVADAQKLANDLEQANLKIDELKARGPEVVDERVVVEGFFKRIYNNLFKK